MIKAEGRPTKIDERPLGLDRRGGPVRPPVIKGVGLLVTIDEQPFGLDRRLAWVAAGSSTTPDATPGGQPPVAPAAPPANQAAPEPEVPAAQANAIRSAESYLSFSGFSRSGLIGQLEYEQYSTDEATLAVDSLDVDWNAEAAESAARYLEVSSFSRSGLIDQLEYEGFTSEQAEYGVSQAYG